MTSARVFSGLQPTGNLTLGNYLGAIKHWAIMQDEYECLFCLVDLHALTTNTDPHQLYESTLNNYAMFMACGLDPNKAILFNQSKVAAHAELAWILSCCTQIGWLNRMTQFKDKAGKDKQKANLGLYAYPTLMTADILLYKATLVPVGDDQTQHIELARDIAGAFNRKYDREFFTLPEFCTPKSGARIMSLRDGTNKMSKSDPSDMSRINLSDSPELITKKLQKAKTDAISGISIDKENRPEVTNLINIMSEIEGVAPQLIADRYAQSSNAQFKNELAEAIIVTLSPIMQKYKELSADKSYLISLLAEHGARANELALTNLEQIKKIAGLI